MRVVLLSLCLLPLLTACERRDETVTPGPARGERVQPAEPVPAPPLDLAPTFVGVWAAKPELCGNGAWMFTPQGVRTAGEVSCTWTKVEKTESGYTLVGPCTAEAETKPEEVLLLLDPATPDAMTVTGGPWDVPISLKRCTGAATVPGGAAG